jgi:hypothetical protein
MQLHPGDGESQAASAEISSLITTGCKEARGPEVKMDAEMQIRPFSLGYILFHEFMF